MIKIPRIMIAGTHSGVGKTTIATGIMAALARRGLKVQAFKTGPDYIDPGYHTLVTGRPSRNLDAFMLPADILEQLFAKAAAKADIAIIEGVMGLFDGGAGGVGSTANLAKQLKTPVILVVDVGSMADSAGALVYGFIHYDPEVRIAGVILNRTGSERHYRMVKEVIETKLGVSVLGCLHKHDKFTIPERHLGLVPVEEKVHKDWLKLAERIEEKLDLDMILEFANKAGAMTAIPLSAPHRKSDVRIGIARDEAFTFYYQDGLETLECMGAELVYFSPLRDEKLPEGVDGLIFGGGFPEMFVQELSANVLLQNSIRQADAAGMPIYGECGGLMYLCREMTDFEGNVYPLAGLVPAACQMQKRLVTVGYVEAEACQDTVLCPRKGKLRGHEFHFSTMVPDDHTFSWAFSFKNQRDGSTYPGGYCSGNLLASYLHCHFAGNPEAAVHFLEKCREFKGARDQGPGARG